MSDPFQFIALPAELFAPWFGKSDEELRAAGAARVVASSKPGFPCRVSLVDAEVGESVLSLPFVHHDVTSPYRASGPIFVRTGAVTARPAVNEIPALLRHRLLSLRAYDAAAMMVAAEVVQGSDLEPALRRLLRDQAVNYIDVHNAAPGCFNCRVLRAGAGPTEISFWHEVNDAGAATGFQPRDVVAAWVDAFNRRDADALAALYSEDAVNHQVAEEPVAGRAALREMFAAGFTSAEMICIVENVFQDGEWVILEWRDPLGLRGCGFFHIVAGQIVFQRGYWDKLTFLRQHGLPIPEAQ